MKKYTVILIGLIIILMVVCVAMFRPKPQSSHLSVRDVTNSKYNLKMIGLSFRLWAGDHNGQFPFNVSQAEGGTRELCDRDSDGFDKNPAPVFMAMSNELFTTKILVSPNDRTKTAATGFASLTTKNISYKLRTGANVSLNHPLEVLAVDPINDLVLRSDGSVQKSSR
jgi:hypothetical protein